MQTQEALPEEILSLSDAQVLERIAECKGRLGKDLVILGHHYQQNDIISFADFVGDSLGLSRLAAQQSRARWIVFCGVHFMAESADILTSPEQIVILPDLSAGCSMADMARLPDAQACWEKLNSVGSDKIVPITYVNSSAVIKALVGRVGGLCCTSSNAAAAIRWALERGQRVLFLPDQHLGRNTAYQMGYPLESMALWDPDKPDGGLSPQELAQSKFVLWNGYCSVHQIFREADIQRVRSESPQTTIIVHPECCFEVVQKSDRTGSTAQIIKAIEQAPPGSSWAIGTEVNLVARLAQRHPDKHIESLSLVQCLCATMYRVDPRHLLRSLQNLLEGQVINRIQVDSATAADARLALERMLEIK